MQGAQFRRRCTSPHATPTSRPAEQPRGRPRLVGRRDGKSLRVARSRSRSSVTSREGVDAPTPFAAQRQPPRYPRPSARCRVAQDEGGSRQARASPAPAVQALVLDLAPACRSARSRRLAHDRPASFGQDRTAAGLIERPLRLRGRAGRQASSTWAERRARRARLLGAWPCEGSTCPRRRRRPPPSSRRGRGRAP